LTRKRGTAKLAAKARFPPALWGEIPQPLHRDPSGPVTELLVRWRAGDREALEELMPLVYEELRRLAHHYLRQERTDHTLQSTALVHEAYLRLAGQNPPQWQDRAHFFGIAAHIMRQILVEYARSHNAAKRGGNALTLTLDEAVVLPQQMDVDVVALDKALNELSGLDAQQGRIVELRFFAGLTIEDTSEVMGISPATVKRDWVTARAWLFRAMTGEAPA
jgi:RNA polymerase sigma factor (TIGR02999 family)